VDQPQGGRTRALLGGLAAAVVAAWGMLVLRATLQVRSVAERLMELSGGKTSAASGRAFVDVVQAIQDRARPDRTGGRTWTQLGCLQAERPHRTLGMVVTDEPGQDGSRGLLVEHDQVVQALAAQRADHPFHDGIRAR
jgi:hypothetical protein